MTTHAERLAQIILSNQVRIVVRDQRRSFPKLGYFAALNYARDSVGVAELNGSPGEPDYDAYVAILNLPEADVRIAAGEATFRNGDPGTDYHFAVQVYGGAYAAELFADLGIALPQGVGR
jgi:hypothetical protein